MVDDLGFTTLLTSQIISVAFYSERENADKFCLEALISAWGSFTCRKSMTRDPWLYFPSEGSHTQDFYALKSPFTLAGFESVNLGSIGEYGNHGTTRVDYYLFVLYQWDIWNFRMDSVEVNFFRFHYNFRILSNLGSKFSVRNCNITYLSAKFYICHISSSSSSSSSECSAQGQAFHCKRRNQGCSSAKRQVFHWKLRNLSCSFTRAK